MAGIQYNNNVLDQGFTPAFLAGDTASRPNFGFIGRIYVDTQAEIFYRDYGNAWVQIGGSGGGGGGFIPYMGAILGALPAVFIAFTQSPLMSVFAVILFYIIHLIEGNLLQPKIMQKVVGLNPIVSIMAILAGFKLAGIIGAVLSIPVATALAVFIKDVFDSRTGKREVEEV